MSIALCSPALNRAPTARKMLARFVAKSSNLVKQKAGLVVPTTDGGADTEHVRGALSRKLRPRLPHHLQANVAEEGNATEVTAPVAFSAAKTRLKHMKPTRR